MDGFIEACKSGNVLNIIEQLRIADENNIILDIQKGYRIALRCGKIEVIKYFVSLYKINSKYKKIDIDRQFHYSFLNRQIRINYPTKIIDTYKFIISLHLNDINYRPLKERSMSRIFVNCCALYILYKSSEWKKFRKYLLSLYLNDNKYSKININISCEMASINSERKIIIYLVSIYKKHSDYQLIDINNLSVYTFLYIDKTSYYKNIGHNNNLKSIKFFTSLYKKDPTYKPVNINTLNKILCYCVRWYNVKSTKYLLNLHLIDSNYIQIDINDYMPYSSISIDDFIIRMTRFTYCKPYNPTHVYRPTEEACGFRMILNEKIIL